MFAEITTTIVSRIDLDEMKVSGHDVDIDCSDDIPMSAVLAVVQGALLSAERGVRDARRQAADDEDDEG